MNLSKILDLVKNKHKNISRKANVFTLDEARKLNDKYPYAIVNAYTGRPVYLCEDKESANMMWNKMFRCCATTPLIVDLNENYKQLMNELSITENMIAEYRSNFNKQVKQYNRYVRKFPTSILLNMTGYEKQDYSYLEYDVSEDAPQDLFGDK